MLCNICTNKSNKFYCANCVKTSPKLVILWRFKLLKIQDENKQLNDKIDKILDNALTNTTYNGNDDILQFRMMKVNLLKLKRRNMKIGNRLIHLTETVDHKRQQISELKKLLETPKPQIYEPESALSFEMLKIEQNGKIVQIRNIVSKRQEHQLKLLSKWFAISRRDSFELPYTISFQPVISLKNLSNLPYRFVMGSIFKIFEYIQLMGQILSIRIMFQMNDESEDDYQLRDTIAFTEEFVMKRTVSWLTKIVQNMIHMCQQINMLPLDEPIDILNLLDQYDIDGIFYNMTQQIPLQYKTTSRAPMTFDNMYQIVNDLIYNASRISIA